MIGSPPTKTTRLTGETADESPPTLEDRCALPLAQAGLACGALAAT
jgi:hypothetical protein